MANVSAAHTRRSKISGVTVTSWLAEKLLPKLKPQMDTAGKPLRWAAVCDEHKETYFSNSIMEVTRIPSEQFCKACAKGVAGKSTPPAQPELTTKKVQKPTSKRSAGA